MPRIHVNRGFDVARSTLQTQGGRAWLTEIGDKLAATGASVKVGVPGQERTLSTAAELTKLYDDAVRDGRGTAAELGLSPWELNGWFNDLAQTLDDIVKPTSDVKNAEIDLRLGSDLSRVLGLDSGWMSYASAQTDFGKAPDGSLTVADVMLSRVAAPPTPTLDPKDGRLEIGDRATFEELARRDNVPGALGVREVKFVVDIETNKVYFMNTKEHAQHFFFANKALGFPDPPQGIREFNSQTYFTDNRKFMAGSLIAHDAYESPSGEKGLYTMEFWPTDPVAAKHVSKAFELVAKGMPFADGKVRYHPAGETQRDLYQREKADFDAAGVDVISTGELFGAQTFSALNQGVGFGTLRVIDGRNDRPPSARDVVIFRNIPNDLTRVGGVITNEPQTPLSHVNLKAKQNDTPNAYIKDAENDPEIAPLIGKLVRYEVTPDGFQMREATQAEAQAYLDSIRPPHPQEAPRDLSVTTIAKLSDIGTDDLKAYGAKAANLGELQNVLPAGMSPEGFGVPIAMYERFMQESGLYDDVKTMMADPQFQSDPEVRDDMLRDLRRKIRRTEVPQDIRDALEAMHDTFPDDQPLRCRSSTNNEDLEGFNGAGLYASYTHRPDEGSIVNTIRQVWSSLWTLRAFDERDFHRIDHMSAGMGVAVHPNFDDELANGVAVTKNIYDPNWEGFYVNAQVGEALVTNPDGATPDELLISAIGPNRELETQYIRRSTLTDDDKHVMTDDQIKQLTDAMRAIQRHFRQVYGARNNPDFAMDIEFKFDVNGKLVIKQARPWVD